MIRSGVCALVLIGAFINAVSATGLCAGTTVQVTVTTTPTLFPGIFGSPAISDTSGHVCMWQLTAPAGNSIKFTLTTASSDSDEHFRVYEGTAPVTIPYDEDLQYDEYVGLLSSEGSYLLAEGATVTSYTNKAVALLYSYQAYEFEFNYTIQAVPQNNAVTSCASSSPVCASCSYQSSYYCVNCSTTSFDYCVNPKSGYFSTNGLPPVQCADSYCVRCSGTNSNQCLACDSDGYYLKGDNTCGSCNYGLSCATCTDGNSCATCQQGYYLTNSRCCYVGQYYNAAQDQCQYCPDSSCGICTGTTGQTCTQCKSTYSLDYTGKCSTCDSSCATCYANLTCSACATGHHQENTQYGPLCCADQYYWDSTDKECKDCSNSNCDRCVDTGAQFQTCIQCADGYLLGLDGQCGQCSGTNCKTCNTDLTCASCDSQYPLLFNGSCYDPSEDKYCEARCLPGTGTCGTLTVNGNTTYVCNCGLNTDGEWCDRPKMCIKTVGILLAFLLFFLLAGAGGVIQFLQAAKKKMEADKKEMEEAEGKGVEAIREIWDRNDKAAMAIHKDTMDKEFGYVALIKRKDLEKPREPIVYWLRHGYDFTAPCFPFKGEEVLLRNRIMLMIMTILSAIFFNILLAQLGGNKKETAQSGSVFKLDFGRGVWIGLLCNVLKKIFSFIIKRGLRAEAQLEAGVVKARREAKVAKIAAATGVAVETDPNAPPKPKMVNQPNKKVGIIMVVMFAIIVCINIGVIIWQMSVQTCASFFSAFVSSYLSSLVVGVVVYLGLGVARYFFLVKFGAEPKADEKVRY